MNRKGQGLFMSIIVGVMIFMVGVLFINFLTPEVTVVRNATNLDCSNAAGISDGTKLACLVVDLVIPYFILIIFSFAGGIIAARFLI